MAMVATLVSQDDANRLLTITVTGLHPLEASHYVAIPYDAILDRAQLYGVTRQQALRLICREHYKRLRGTDDATAQAQAVTVPASPV